MTIYVPRRVIRRVEIEDEIGARLTRFVIALDGTELANDFETAHTARMDVDMACFTQSVGFALRSTQESFSEETITLAYEVACRFFRSPDVRESVKKGTVATHRISTPCSCAWATRPCA